MTAVLGAVHPARREKPGVFLTLMAKPPGDYTNDDWDFDWRDLAACASADPEAWFPDIGSNGIQAKRICRTCDVRTECLAFAMETREPWGIWGGFSARERLSLRDREDRR